MPELPEAETIVRGVRPAVTGRAIRLAHVLHADVLRTSPRAFRRAVRGAHIVGVARRGKNVILELHGGSVIAVNLGMTGRVLPFPTPPRGRNRPTHPAVRFYLDDGSVVVFDDQRRFGTVEHLTAPAWRERSGAMGPEPLAEGFTPELLHQALAPSRAPMRSWLLDQKRIAGVGNIYAAEALFLSGIHPRREARSVSGPEARRLHEAIRAVLTQAIDSGGTTIRDYRNADGGEGRFARRLQVYGRDGEPCLVCGTPVERLVFSNRSAFLCPRCQPASGGPAAPRRGLPRGSRR